jgi:hypothetical protein
LSSWSSEFCFSARKHDAHRDLVLGVAVECTGVTSSPERPMRTTSTMSFCATPSSAALLCATRSTNFLRVFVHRVVDADDIGRALEGRAHLSFATAIWPA